MKKFLTIVLLCLASSQFFSQNSTGAFTILLGGSVGKFNIDAGGNFNTVYSDRKPSTPEFPDWGTARYSS